MNPQVKRRKKLAATDARNFRTLLLLSVLEPQDIGARIAAARKEAGLTQEELADLIGVSTRSMQGYESGDVIPYRRMARLAETTGRTVGFLLHGDATETEDQMTALRGEVAEVREMVAKLLGRPA